METKTCKQCGELKPIDQFRRYYGGRKGTYTMCKQCERINARAKYLMNKQANDSLNLQELDELDKIHTLWKYQASLGLQPPSVSAGRKTSLSSDLDSMLKKYSDMSGKLSSDDMNAVDAPSELLGWLTAGINAELTAEPDYYLDEVYEELKRKYRPIVKIDQQSMMPVYDDKYKAILDRILDLFNEYEDSYYERNDG